MKRPASASASPGLHCRNDTLTYRDTTAWVLPESDQMRVFWQPIAKLSQAETRLFASILTIAALLLAFGLRLPPVIASCALRSRLTSNCCTWTRSTKHPFGLGIETAFYL